jgi:hypothetical protein
MFWVLLGCVVGYLFHSWAPVVFACGYWVRSWVPEDVMDALREDAREGFVKLARGPLRPWLKGRPCERCEGLGEFRAFALWGQSRMVTCKDCCGWGRIASRRC